ncbi:MAG: hypothetical protein IPG84_09210 [Betaproteobacteria bacterium]|nr:hypothetical protein [Betaproteobacteria bacterium]
MPPIDGLQDIWPSVSMLCVRSSVATPMRAEASAASVPGWPPPTITPNLSLKSMIKITNCFVGRYGFKTDILPQTRPVDLGPRLPGMRFT